MNVAGKISLGLTAALVLNPGAWVCGSAPVAVATPVRPVAPQESAAIAEAADATTAAPAPVSGSGQPYATIVARNIFGLVPVPPPPPPPAPPEDPPPKITANGIMSVFGELQALFKVTEAPKGGQPAKDVSYMLSAGQRQDDIEVTKIDEKGATITFNNHGTVQEIPLTEAKDTGGAGPAPAGGAPGAAPGVPGAPALPRFRPRGGLNAGGGGGNPAFSGGGGAIPTAFNGGNPGALGGGSPVQPQYNGGLNAGGASSGLNNQLNSALNSPANPTANAVSVAEQAQQNTAGLTPEQQILLMEAERARLQTAEKPEFPPEMIPPTSMTPGENPGSTSGNNASGTITP